MKRKKREEKKKKRCMMGRPCAVALLKALVWVAAPLPIRHAGPQIIRPFHLMAAGTHGGRELPEPVKWCLVP